MDNRPTQTNTRQTRISPVKDHDGNGELTQKRLNTLLALNAETAREKALFATDRERFESELIRNPLTSEKTYAYLGLLLGTFPPAAIFTRFFMDAGLRGDDFWIFGVLAIVNLISGVVGYFSGKVIGKIVREIEKLPWLKMFLLLPFIGMLWGMMSGGAGGVIIFVIGAIFGAYFGALVGSIALPLFAVFHRWLKKGDLIERNQFLPVAFGITLVICGFILGL